MNIIYFLFYLVCKCGRVSRIDSITVIKEGSLLEGSRVGRNGSFLPWLLFSFHLLFNLILDPRNPDARTLKCKHVY